MSVGQVGHALVTKFAQLLIDRQDMTLPPTLREAQDLHVVLLKNSIFVPGRWPGRATGFNRFKVDK